MKRFRKFGKRFLASLCTLALLVTSLGPGIQVAAGSGSGDSREQMERDMEAAIKESLKNEDSAISKDYPKGIFSFATLKGEVNEENRDPLAVYLVRHGGTKGEQKVKIKFSDYSAEYGKDYYAKLEDSMFAKKVEANPDSVPLFYMFGDDPEADGEQTAIDEESVIKAYGEERGKKIIELTREYSAAEAKAQARAEAASGSGASAKKKNSEKFADKKKADKKDNGKEEASSPLDQLIDGTSQYTDSGYALTMDDLLTDDERNESTAAYGANMLDTIFPGAETELSFADGEVMKKIYIYPIDNEVSDGDRVFNIQINGGSEDLAWQAGENSSAVTIRDNEKDETSHISIGDCTETVGADGKASVTLKREDGLYKVSTVKFVVKAAKKKVAKGTAVFMPGMKERTVEFTVSDVDRKTVDNISFILKNPVGAKVSGEKKKIIDLTDLKTSRKLKGSTSGKDVDEDESPVGMNGTLAYDGIKLDLRNFQQDEKTGCNGLTFSASESELKLHMPDHGCSCKNARVAAKLKKKINQEAVESVSIEFERSDQEASTCNRMYVAKVNKSSGADYGGWNDSRDNVMAAKGDQSRGTMMAKFTDGSVSNVSHLADYKNEYLKYAEGSDSPYTDLSITSKKTSGGVNGMKTTVYGVRLNFRKYTVNIKAANELDGHTGEKPGQLLLAKTETPGENNTEEVSASTRYAYEKVNFKNYPADYAYLDHLQFADGTAIDQKYCEIGGTTATLDMNDDFFNQYQKQIDSTNGKIDIQPVYAKKSVKLTINADKHGGIEVEGKQYPRGTKGKEITVHVGDKLKVKPYDVEEDYYFSSYEMIATGLDGKGDSKKVIYSAEEPDNMDIGNYNYTIKPTYTFDGTSVVINTENIPEGCGIDKTEWTYKADGIHSGQILDIKANTGEGYRAKWTITSNTHEWYGKTFYGDVFYHEIGGPTDEIELEFEKCSDMQYVSITGKALVQDATIKNKPFLNSQGVYLGDYVPVANALVQMGEFSSLTKQDGGYTIYSHTESEETAQEKNSDISDPSGTNITTYFRAGSNETRTVKVIHNGLEQVHYLKITGDLSGVKSSQSEPYVVTDVPALELDFFGDGPTPYSINTLLGTVDGDDYPTRLETSEQIEMRNYSVGFELKLDDVLDENGEDRIDKVNFYIYNKNDVMKSMHTVEREEHGQTDYVLDRYLMQDDKGEIGYMKLNGLIDFADGDKIYVELVGTMKDQNGNKVEDADMTYGMYDSGIRFQEKLDVIEVQLKDVEPSTSSGTQTKSESGNSGVPTVDVLGQMLPTLKLGRLTVTAIISSNFMEFSVGFDVKKLNKSIYDSENAENVKNADNLKNEIDEDESQKSKEEAERNEKKQEVEDLNNELSGIQDSPGEPTEADQKRISEIDEEITKLNTEIAELDNSISQLDEDITEKQSQYDELTGSPEAQTDPLDPAVPEEAEGEKMDVTSEITPEEITNVTEVTGPELNPLDKNGLWKDMKNRLLNEAEKSGLTKPKSNSLQGHGTVSANLSVDIGVTIRFKTQVVDGGDALWCFDKALVYARVTGGIMAMYYLMIPEFPVPLYAGLNFTASAGLYAGVGASVNLTLDEMGDRNYDGSELYFSGDIPVTLGIEGFVGMGLKSLLAIELGLGFLQKFDFAYASNGGQVGTGMSSFYGYVQTNLLFFSFKWKFAQVNWKYEMYNTTKNATENVQKLMQDNGLGSDAALADFTVAQTPKVHYYGGAKAENVSKKLRSSYEKNDSTVLAEGLTQTVSDVVPLGDGKYLMAFEGVRTAADCPDDMQPDSADYDYNSKAIYLSYYDGAQWSKPAILQKDDTLDTGLQVEDMGDDILISWSSADRRFTKEEIATGEMTEDGQEIKADAAVQVLSSLDVYAAVLKKSDVDAFVTASAEDKAKDIDRLTEDRGLTDAQRQMVEAGLAEGADYMGYGHENGQAVSVGDQIYLFYDTLDYNHWKGGEKSENLSDIVDANGYIFYKIYDRKTGKWLEEYADPADESVYEKLGFTQGQRMADVHFNVAESDERILPMASQMDAQTVKVQGEDRVALTYLVDSDGVTGTDSTGAPQGDQALFIAFMTPAEITDGAVKAEAKWSEPLQMNTELSCINDPQMIQTKQNGENTLYLVWADDDRLMYSNLTQLFHKVELERDEAGSGGEGNLEGDEKASSSYTPVEMTTAVLQNGKKVEVYTMKEGIEPKIGILGDEENGFQYNNGYRLAADDKGHIYAVWAQSSGSAQGLYLSAMSMTGGEEGTEVWSKPKTLNWDETSGGKYLTDPSIAVDSDGNIILGHNAYNLENVTTKDEEGNELLDSRRHVDDTFCVTVEKAIGSPVLEDAELSNDYPRAGEEFTVTASAGNDGFLAAEELNVKAEFVQKKGDTETVLDTQTQSYTNVGSGHREELRLPFTMKQEYLDAAKNDKAAYQIRLTAVEKKAGTEENYKETATAAVDVKTGAHYVFTHENVEGYRCRGFERDAEAGTIRFGKETGENRYRYTATVVNDGNLPAEDMKVSMFASNENAFMNDQNKNGTYEGTPEEWTAYNKVHSAEESVANNKKFNNWISLKSFTADEVKSLGVGESAELDAVTVKIPDNMYSDLGGMDLMMAVYDNAAKENDATKNEGLSTLPVSIVEEENADLSIWCGGKKAENQTLESGSTASLNALVMPLKAAPDYDVLWDSSNPEVATVDNGNVTAVGPGTATIKASLMKDGKETMSRAVDVTVTGDGTPVVSPTPTPVASQEPSAASQKPPAASQEPPAASQKPPAASQEPPTASKIPSATQAPQVTQNSAKKQVKVTFNGNKGKVKETSTKTVTVGEKYGTFPKATRKGYDFKGWYTEKSGGTKVTKDTKVTNQSAHSLYAHWKKVKVDKAQIKKLTAKKGKKLKVTLKPVKSADGYQICYSPKKKFKKKNTKKQNTKKKTATLKKLKKGKTWYVKVRAYKLDSAGDKVYGKYGKVKKKKVKS